MKFRKHWKLWAVFILALLFVPWSDVVDYMREGNSSKVNKMPPMATPALQASKRDTSKPATAPAHGRTLDSAVAPVLARNADANGALLQFIAEMGIIIGKLQTVGEVIAHMDKMVVPSTADGIETKRQCAIVLFHQLERAYKDYQDHIKVMNPSSQFAKVLARYDVVFKGTLDNIGEKYDLYRVPRQHGNGNQQKK